MDLLSRDDILNALEALARELASLDIPTEIVIGGGAALVLLYKARDTTRDVDAFALISENAPMVRQTARRIAESLGLPENWLNDGAKGYLHGLATGEILFQRLSLIV